MDALTADLLARLADRHGLAEAAVVVRPLDGRGGHASFRDDASIYPASMIKVPLVAVALAEVADGRFSLAYRVEVGAANMTVNDAPSPLEPGYRATLEELCRLAVSRSDNVATNVLFDLIGRERATEVARTRFGLAGTAFYRKLSGADPLIDDPQWDGVHLNAHPAADAGRLFAAIASERIPHAPLLRDALEDQYWNDKLSEGLNEGDRFAHKTGDTSAVSHDGGLLTTAEGRTYVVVVYTGLESNERNNQRFAPFMRDLRRYL